MARYEIAFSAQLVPGAQLDWVKANLAKLFQADEQRLALLFSGRRIVIKSNLDAAGAEKYRATMERAGAVAEVVNLDDGVEEIILTAAPPASTAFVASASASMAPAAAPVQNLQGAQSAPVGRLQVRPRDEYMAAFSEVDAPDFGIAELGAPLQDAKPEVPGLKVDLSGISLAPVGSDMGQLKRSEAVLVPDVSHLKLES